MAHRAPSRSRAGWTAAGAVALACTLTPDARADEPTPSESRMNPNVYPEPAAQPNLLLIGAGVTVGWYAAAFGMSYLWPESDGASSLRIPVAGPYMALAKTGCSSHEPTCGTFTLVIRTVLTGLTAIGQTGGVLAMAEGLFLPTATRRERPRPQAKIASAVFHVAPMAPPALDAAGPVSQPGGLQWRRSSAFNDLGLTIFGNF